MDMFVGEALEIDLVYADARHPENIFDIAVYHKHARLILHRELARIVLKTSRILKERYGWTLVLKDGLRTIEAQRALMDTDIVRRNPHWLEEPRLLSGPGQGAHPRGMAIDVSVKDAHGTPVNMGTLFDAMVPESARAYGAFSPEILQNRAVLEQAFVESATSLSTPLLPLPSEWWDFRLPASYNGLYEPLSDGDLPDGLKMCKQGGNIETPDFTQLAKDILLSI
jgi:zinc D-Ala-D-Ala dipeptidase